MQELSVAVIVIASTAYAVWSLMPSAWRGALLRRLGRAPQSAGACGGCGGCGSDAAKAAPTAPTSLPGSAVITVHRRPPTA